MPDGTLPHLEPCLLITLERAQFMHLTERSPEARDAIQTMKKQRYLEQLVADHQSGRREYSAPLWSLLMFQAAIQNDDFAIG